jgi:type I restriction enzyme, S subunit
LVGKTNTFLYDKPSVLIGRKGTIDVPQYTESPFWTIDTLFYTEIFEQVYPKFIFYKFNLINWYSYNEASGVPSLNSHTIENIDCSIPPLLEQRAIARVLAEIEGSCNQVQSVSETFDV